MSRALIAIGVNVYEHIGNLEGAEKDAQQIFDHLTNPEIGDYDLTRSRLLLSPTLDQVRGTVADIVLEGPRLEELTFFFAGHGLIERVGFYMGVRNTVIDRATATAFSLSELFAHLASVAPTQTNIILDACFSGGLAADLSMLTRPETSGYIGSPAVTLLAMSARDQPAGELPEGGIGTTALLDCILGKALVREDISSLELLDIGQVVIQRVRRMGLQNPVLSALNVHKRSSFCRNPLFQASARTALEHWDPRNFLNAIEPVLASHAHAPIDLIADIERLFDHMIEKAESSRDIFKQGELKAVAAIAMMPYASLHVEIRDWLRGHIASLSDDLTRKLSETTKALANERYAMLAGSTGIANLFLLPIRLSKLIGWTGAAFHLDRLLARSVNFPRDEFANLLNLILEHYPLSLSAMSDGQAPYLAIALTAANELQIKEEGELVLSSIFNSFVACRAKVADVHIDPSNILPYLIARATGSFLKPNGQIAQPSELGLVLLLLSNYFDLKEVFDEAMIHLDHATINAFLAEDYSQFGRKVIHDGENNTFTIGHHFFTVEEFLKLWPSHAADLPSDNIIACCAILAALVFPDRVPWFVFRR